MADEVDVQGDKRVKQAWSETDSRRTNLKQIMRPVLICMAMAGCYNFKDLKPERGRTWKSIFSPIYRTAICLIPLCLLCHRVAGLVYLPASFFNFSLLGTVWTTYIISMLLINLKSTSSRFGQYAKVFQFWEDKIMPEFEEFGINYNVSKTQKKCFLVLIAACINVVLNIIAGVALTEFANPYSVTAPFLDTTITITILLAMFSVAFFIWVIPIAFAVIFSIVLCEAFDSFCESTKKSCKQHDCKMASNFQKLRLLHVNLCKLVSDLDQDFRWYYGSSFVFNIALAVFTLYQVMRTTITSVEIAVFLFWGGSSMLHLGLTAIFAAFVHESAHAPLDHIYYLNVQDITVEKLAQLNMFLSKLTGTQIGFSTCGFLIITKEFILTIAGVFLTYFVVLYTL